MTKIRNLLLIVVLAGLCACTGAGGSTTPGTQASSDAAATTSDSGSASASSTSSDLSATAQVGKMMFEDKTLSVSGQQSCATCHVAQFAFSTDTSATGPDHGSPVPLGGVNMDQPGFRNTPSIMYASFVPKFYFGSDGSPNGGFFRDGRAATLGIQAQEPLTTSFEMANADAAAVIAKLQTRPYLAQFTAIYGPSVLSDPATALARMGDAIAAYETEDPEFHPFSSKFDAFLAGRSQLTPQELRGYGLFNNSTKGNCAACHPSTSADGVTPPMFTDFSFDNLGLPRNQAIPANSDSAPPAYTPNNVDDGVHNYYDLGICGPLRPSTGRDLFGICGQFKVPTLRNIALTAPYFHNGQFSTLVQAVQFYVQRDTSPNLYYPTLPDGTVTKFDDLPAVYGGGYVVNWLDPSSDTGYVGNVNTLEIPYNRKLGGTPALDADEINDLVAFLCTLTDGYDPANPDALVLPQQCVDATTATATIKTARTSRQ